MPRLCPAFLLMSLVYFGAPATTSAQLAKDSIEAAHAYSAKRGGIGLIVREGGQTRFERYAKGHAADEPIHIYSGTKSFFGALAVIAEKEGLLSLDEKVAETLPEWRDNPRKARITIRELLDFTSGLETGFEEIYGRSTADKLTLSLGLDAKTDPGDSFIYGPSHLQVFCEVMRRKLKRKGMSYQTYLDRKLIDPLGIRISQWRADSHGNVIPSAGIYMSGRHWMTFGEMVCRGGEWNGKQIVPAEDLTKCFKPTPINPAFGLCFWVNSYCTRPDAREIDVEETLEIEPLPEDWSRACLSKQAPPDLICSLGSNFQRLYMVPSMDLVIVHQGKKGARGFRDAEFLPILFDGARRPAPEAAPTEVTERKVKPLFPKGFGGFLKKGAETDAGGQ